TPMMRANSTRWHPWLRGGRLPNQDRRRHRRLDSCRRRPGREVAPPRGSLTNAVEKIDAAFGCAHRDEPERSFANAVFKPATPPLVEHSNIKPTLADRADWK